jgi:2-polyprenyl-3-methyl-5-hydroxy-6-metoxy-1,4-benzoquinol methylase
MDEPALMKPCPLCQCVDHHLFDQRISFGVPVRYAICDYCGFVFQPVDKLSQELDDFYSVDYRLIYQGSEAPSTKDRSIQSARAAHLVGLLKANRILSIQRALDVGSSAGIFMLKLHERFGCQVVGIEPGSAYRQQAQDQGLLVYPSLEEMIAVENSRFNFISLVHVLEHLPDPLETLTELRRKWLVPNGWLLLEVPNLYTHDSLELAHLSAFSRHSLRQMAARAGFSVVWLGAHGQPRSRLLKLYITLLAKPTAEGQVAPAVQPERQVRFKRQAGLAYRKVIERLMPSLAWLPIQS